MPGPNTSRTCTLCGHKVIRRHVNFIDSGKLWRVPIFICVDPICLSTRGATFQEIKTH